MSMRLILVTIIRRENPILDDEPLVNILRREPFFFIDETASVFSIRNSSV
ncbi:hypothetical protein [Caldibacillus thermoamylovorans]|nr:hypothetical protein [Caldibacillus thermoamylovorans]